LVLFFPCGGVVGRTSDQEVEGSTFCRAPLCSTLAQIIHQAV